MDRALEDQAWEHARSRCEYCLLPARYTEAPFQIDHIIAKKHGGEIIAANLALSCGSPGKIQSPRAQRNPTKL
jgi:5-methylcytosine-specific restriction endonuclease McrA